MPKSRNPDPWRAPSHLDAAARREWTRVASLLRDRNGLDELRHEALLRYVYGWALFQKAARELPNAATPMAIEQLSQSLARSGRQVRAAAEDLGVRAPVLASSAGDDSHLARDPADFFRMTAPATGKGKRH